MKNNCKDCGVCCLDTSMILSLEDISLILRNYASNKLRREDFVFKNKNGHFQLINIENRCVFFDTISKTCKIYRIRPKGCRFYPLIYDFDKKECVFDKDCPRTHLFFQNNNDIERVCKDIKKFLEEQLFIKRNTNIKY